MHRSLQSTIATAAFALAAGFLLAAPAKADPRDERICALIEPGDPFAACTRVIADAKIDAKARARAFANRATNWDKQGKLDQAMADYDAAIGLDQTIFAAYFNRARLWEVKGEVDRMIADLDVAARLDPKDAETFYRRGVGWARRGDMDKAIADYDAAFKLDPKHVRAVIGRAVERDKAGQLQPALADADLAVRLAPTDPSGYLSRGAVRSKLGQVDAAIADFDAAIKLDPRFMVAYVNRASLYDRKGDHARALADYEAALKLDIDHAPAHNGRAWSLLKLGRAAEALPEIEKSLALDPNSPEALDTRASIYEALGQLDSAFRDIQQAVAIDGNSVETKASFARIKGKLSAAGLTKGAPNDSLRAGLSGERRVALVIGNAAYRGISPLRNTTNDATSVAERLRNIGFSEVMLVMDANREGLINALAAFSRQAETADWAMVYYAGHGMQIGGTNWLIPTDATLKNDRDIQFQAISLEQVLTSVEGAKKMRLVVLDACRDNPFLATMKVTSATRNVSRGLARVEPGATLVAFSAKDNQLALDGQGRNSPFAEAFLKHMGTPGLEVNRLFRRIADDVLRTTAQKQEPFTYGRLPDEDFFFLPQVAKK